MIFTIALVAYSIFIQGICTAIATYNIAAVYWLILSLVLEILKYREYVFNVPISTVMFVGFEDWSFDGWLTKMTYIRGVVFNPLGF